MRYSCYASDFIQASKHLIFFGDISTHVQLFDKNRLSRVHLPQNFPLPTASALANRLNLALDRIETMRGETISFQEVHDSLLQHGIKLSRSRWSYMLRGEAWRIRDRHLISALAHVLDVPEQFLFTGDLTNEMRSDVPQVRALRAAKIKSYAARVVGDLDPEALAAITNAVCQLEAIDDADPSER